MTSTASSVPSPLSVPTSQAWDNDGAGLWSTFIVGVGTPSQPGRVMISTAGDETWLVLAIGCPSSYGSSCAEDRGKQFSIGNSTSWTNIQQFYTLSLETNLGYTGNGQYGHDIVSLGYPGSGGPTLSNQVVAGIATPDFWLGIFGIDPAPSNFTTLNDPQPSYLWTLNNTRMIPSTSWAYTAGAPYRNDKVQGSLTFGGYDTSRFTSKNVTFPLYNDVERRFIVDLTTITYIPSGVSTITTPTTLMSETISMLIDSTVPYIYLPEDACAKFEAAFGLQYDESNDIYTINSTAHTALSAMNPSITFTLSNTGGQTLDIVLPYAAFDLTATFPVITSGNDTNYFPLKRAANDTQYTLGRAFLQEAYMIADFERSEFTIAPCAWPSTFNQELVPILLPNSKETTNSSNSNSTLPVNHSASSKTPIGAVVGGVVGGIAVILVGLLLAYFFWWKPRSQKNQKHDAIPSEDASDSTPQEGPSGPSTATAFDPTLNKTELDSKQYGSNELLDIREVERMQKHEMYAVPAAQEMDTWVPVGSELDSPQVFEMPAREPVGIEMASPPIDERSPELSPLTPGSTPRPSRTPPGGYFDRRNMAQRTYYNP